MKNIRLGFNTSGNNQTFGRTSQSVGLGKLRSTIGSNTRKFNYCNRSSPDLNVTFKCVFDVPEDLTGKYQIATIQNASRYYYSSDFGMNWTERNLDTQLAGLSITSVALSENGQYILLGCNGALFVSNNGGKTFTKKEYEGTINWFSVQMSKSGQYQAAIGPTDKVYVSENYGKEFTPVELPGIKSTYNLLGMSYDGKYLSITVEESQSAGKRGIYTSYNYGKVGFWEYIDLKNIFKPPIFPYGIAISGDGKIQMLVDDDVNPGNSNVYRSTDYGKTWSYVYTIPHAPGGALIYMAISGTGQYQLLPYNYSGTPPPGPYYIYISHDGGTTFTSNLNIDGKSQETFGPGQWFPCGVSASGRHQSVCNFDGYIYTSNDFGKNWFARTSSGMKTWNNFAMG